MDNATLGMVFAWVILTAIPLVAAWVYADLFTNMFKRRFGFFDQVLRTQVKTRIAWHLAALENDDKPEARKAMRSLAALAMEHGARSKKDAYVVVGKWMRDYQGAYRNDA